MDTVDVRTLKVENRQRKEIPPKHVNDLMETIGEIGLLNPIVTRDKHTLCAGECRSEAVKVLGSLGIGIKFEGQTLPPYMIPYTDLKDADEIIHAKAELAENNIRLDLTWQERDAAIAQISDLIGLTTEKEVTRDDVAEKVYGEDATAYQKSKVEDSLNRQRFSHLPEVQKAKSAKDADKIIRKKMEEEKRQRLSREMGEVNSQHTLIKGDCTEEIVKLKDESFDIILSDPIYGINMHEANAFQRVQYQEGKRHDYDDSKENFDFMFTIMPKELYRVAAEEAHLYLFCDITRFFDVWEKDSDTGRPKRIKGLASLFKSAGWTVWPRPIVWYKGNIGSLPRPEHGPRYTCEYILFAIKGEKKTTGVYHDCISIPQTTGHIHPAGKPASVYYDLLRRSANPGDRVLDFNAGCCPIFPAANKAGCIATAIELSDKYVAEGKLRLDEKLEV